MLKKFTSVLLAGVMALPLAMVPAFAETVFESQPQDIQCEVLENFDYEPDPAEWYIAGGQPLDYSQGDLRSAAGYFHYIFNNKELLGGPQGAYKIEMDVTAPPYDPNTLLKHMSTFINLRMGHYSHWEGIPGQRGLMLAIQGNQIGLRTVTDPARPWTDFSDEAFL